MVLPSGLLYSGTEVSGLPVTLTADRFYGHISPRHPEFAHCWPFQADRCAVCLMTCDDMFLCLDEALRSPIELRRDKDFDDRDNYYGPQIISLATQGYRAGYLQVSVKFINRIGTVVTAFSTNEISHRDRPWVNR